MNEPDLIAALAALGERWRPEAPAYLASFVRLSGLAFFLPAVGERVVPARVRLAAVLGPALLTAIV